MGIIKEWITTISEGIPTKDIEPGKVMKQPGMCNVTKKMIDVYNTTEPAEFFKRFSCSKFTYARRISEYGDPFMNCPLTKLRKVFKS